MVSFFMSERIVFKGISVQQIALMEDFQEVVHVFLGRGEIHLVQVGDGSRDLLFVAILAEHRNDVGSDGIRGKRFPSLGIEDETAFRHGDVLFDPGHRGKMFLKS
jgi:hypothetical protein